jgi:hypothetical protein
LFEPVDEAQLQDTGEMEFGTRLQSNIPRPRMSQLGQKQTCRPEIVMSALHPKADIRRRHLDVRR